MQTRTIFSLLTPSFFFLLSSSPYAPILSSILLPCDSLNQNSTPLFPTITVVRSTSSSDLTSRLAARHRQGNKLSFQSLKLPAPLPISLRKHPFTVHAWLVSANNPKSTLVFHLGLLPFCQNHVRYATLGKKLVKPKIIMFYHQWLHAWWFPP